MSVLVSRHSRKALEGALDFSPIVLIRGARQVGKSAQFGARDLDISQTTAAKYLSLLSGMFLTEQLKPYSRSVLGRESKKRRKAGLNDTGFSASLTGFSEDKIYQPGGREYWGSLVEQFVVGELRKQQAWSETDHRLFHYRSSFGEIDVIVELADSSVILLEVESGHSVRSAAFGVMDKMRKQLGERVRGAIILHGGDTAVTSDGVDVLPINALWS